MFYLVAEKDCKIVIRQKKFDMKNGAIDQIK